MGPRRRPSSVLAWTAAATGATTATGAATSFRNAAARARTASACVSAERPLTAVNLLPVTQAIRKPLVRPLSSARHQRR